MTNKKPVLFVSDPHRAALCLTLGGRLIDCQGRQGRRLSFVFDDADGSATLACAAYIENRPVPIATYLEALRKCRELVWQFKMTIAEENSPYHRTEKETKTEATNANDIG